MEARCQNAYLLRHMDLFLLICRQGAGATVRGASDAVIAGLLAASPLPVRGTPDPVLDGSA